MALAVIAFGSNLPHNGNTPETMVKNSIEAVGRLESVDVESVSRWYRSPAFPLESKAPDFVNGAALLRTGLTPHSLLSELHSIEDAHGRARTARWAPRPLDLDLIAFDDLILPDRATEAYWRTLDPGTAGEAWPDALILPHPRLAERAFVLKPMADVWPDWRHPATGLTVTEMLDALDPADREALQPLD